MRLENILREKVYAFARSPESTNVENKIISQICEKAEIGKLVSVELIDNNDNYDSFKAKTESGIYCVKLTMDESAKEIFDDEFALKNLPYCPLFFLSGHLKDWSMNFSVQEFLEGKSLEDAGKSQLAENLESFVVSLEEIHNSTNSLPRRKFIDYISEEYICPKLSIPSVDFFSDNEIGKICIQEIINLREKIKLLYEPWMEGEKFVHGGISPSRTIISGGGISFINFDNSFSGHPLFDLLSLKYEFFISETIERKALQLYSASFSPQETKKMSEMVKAMQFHNLIMEFVKQIYFYRGVKTRKILQLTEKMSQSFGLFSGLESFEKNKEKIASLFTESVI